MRSRSNKVVVQAYVDAINKQDWAQLDQLVSPEFVRHSCAGGRPRIRSREQLKDFLRRELETFPDAKETLEDLLAEGDKVAARKRFQGTQRGQLGPFPATGRTMMTDYLVIYRLKDGQIVEAWAEWDNLSGLSQLGHYQPPGGQV